MTPQELKQKREAWGLKQEDLAALISKTRLTVNRWENAEKITPGAQKLLEMFFSDEKNRPNKLENDTSEDIGKNHFDIKVKEPLEYFRTKAGTLYEELPNGRFRIHVPKVPFKAYASFIEAFQDEYDEHLLTEAFEDITFTVDQVGRGKYIAFTTANDSMNGGAINDTPGGAEVLARMLSKHHWQDGFRSTQYGWIIVSNTGIFHKDIENTDTPGKIMCTSRNPSPEFPDFPLILDDIHSIWKVIKRTF